MNQPQPGGSYRGEDVVVFGVGDERFALPLEVVGRISGELPTGGATEAIAALEAQLQELSEQLEGATREEAAVREQLSDADARWDAAREAEAEVRVLLARSEADHREAERRREAAACR